jgi:FKBP-type peptidyl-prolyl cis-trans isomerase
VHEEGDGGMVAPGENVSVHYYAFWLSTGEMVDNSFSKGQPYTFHWEEDSDARLG